MQSMSATPADGHLHQRIDEHRYSAIGKHSKNDHGLETIGDLTNNFSVLKKCNGKLECLIYEIEHTIRLHTHKTIYLICDLYMYILRFTALHGIY